AGATATRLADGGVLVAGGGTRIPPPVPASAATARYDPVGDRWFPAAPLREARFGHAAVALRDGTVLVVGGTTATTPTNDPRYVSRSSLAGAERYDPLADRWEDAGATHPVGEGHTATLLADGTVLVAGGAYMPPEGSSSLALAEVARTVPRWPAP
ncbi:MAG: kelch repeat-containing protein, partial [Chloroflexota bacterium]|nr:kelch repeat-containing protein [Chloroflexota bacterium]